MTRRNPALADLQNLTMPQDEKDRIRHNLVAFSKHSHSSQQVSLQKKDKVNMRKQLIKKIGRESGYSWNIFHKLSFYHLPLAFVFIVAVHTTIEGHEALFELVKTKQEPTAVTTNYVMVRRTEPEATTVSNHANSNLETVNKEQGIEPQRISESSPKLQPTAVPNAIEEINQQSNPTLRTVRGMQFSIGEGMHPNRKRMEIKKHGLLRPHTDIGSEQVLAKETIEATYTEQQALQADTEATESNGDSHVRSVEDSVEMGDLTEQELDSDESIEPRKLEASGDENVSPIVREESEVQPDTSGSGSLKVE